MILSATLSLKRLQEGHAEAAGTELYLDLSSLSLSSLGYYRIPRGRRSRATTTASTPPGERQYLGKPPGNDSTWGRQTAQRKLRTHLSSRAKNKPWLLTTGIGGTNHIVFAIPGWGLGLGFPILLYHHHPSDQKLFLFQWPLSVSHSCSPK